MGGTGAGVAIIPIFNFLGLFSVAKAVGLCEGASTTITSSIMNIKRKAVGNYMMHFKLKQSHIKKLMAGLLYLLALKLLWHFVI